MYKENRPDIGVSGRSEKNFDLRNMVQIYANNKKSIVIEGK